MSDGLVKSKKLANSDSRPRRLSMEAQLRKLPPGTVYEWSHSSDARRFRIQDVGGILRLEEEVRENYWVMCEVTASSDVLMLAISQLLQKMVKLRDHADLMERGKIEYWRRIKELGG